MATEAAAQIPAPIAAPGETGLVTLTPQGAQVDDCKAGADGKLAWAFREPIATLLLDGKTVGRHYAGPNWDHVDGSGVTGKVLANAPGKTPNDIAWLKLEVTARRGNGVLVGRDHDPAHQHGGRCHERGRDKAGAFHSAPTPPTTCSCARDREATRPSILPRQVADRRLRELYCWR